MIFLSSYLAFFLTGLAYGLAYSNRTIVDSWQADGIILSSSANNNLMASTMPSTNIDKINATEKANVVAMSAVVLKNGIDNDESKINTVFFGLDQNSFIFPEVADGQQIESDNEVLADISIQKKEDLNIGDSIKIVTNDEQYKIVGFVKNSQFNTQPVFFTSIKNAQRLKYRSVTDNIPDIVNGIVVRGFNQANSLPESLDYIKIADFIQKIPGYQAQVLTFGLMIGMLVIISAFVIGIFMYILTIQKKKVFGIMKAQGVPIAIIVSSVIYQTVFLTGLGVCLGLLINYLTSLFLPGGVPYINNWAYLLGIAGLMMLTALVGSMLSVVNVTKIDPLEAIE